MNKNYNLKLDLQFRCNNSKMIFDEFDENTSDFFMQITRQGKKIDISNVIPTLLVLKPSGVAVSQILNVKDGLIYGNLNNSLKNEVGTYISKLMLVEGDKKTFISNISYEVTENALLGKIDNDIVEDERYSVLLQLLERLSNIELQEQTRVDNENSRIEAENLREESIEKIKNDIDFLVNETNKKVNDNLNSNTSKIDNLIIGTKEELNKYKENKDKFINEDLEEFKENTNKSIDNYKTFKDVEINNSLNTYKTNTTNDINSFKNTINSEIDNAKTQMQDSINNKLIEVENSEQLRQEEFENITNQLSSYSSDLNTVKNNIKEHNTRLNALEKGVINNSKIDNLEAKVENHETRIKVNENTLKHHSILLESLNDLDETISIENEEGAVISLPQSKDGTITINELQGNTLVNYCTNGSEELTLNNEINVQGANVTLTDTVDNGLVDVVCEGNTLVNRFDRKQEWIGSVYKELHITTITNGTFSIIGKIGDKSSNSRDAVVEIKIKNTSTGEIRSVYATFSNGHGDINKVVTLTQDEYLYFNCFNVVDDNFNKNYPTMMILEGDYTNKPIPPYFEGMKSVGECEDNKIEIVSQLFDGLFEDGTYDYNTGLPMSYYNESRNATKYISIQPNSKYVINSVSNIMIWFYDNNKDFLHCVNNTNHMNNIEYIGDNSYVFTTPSNAYYINFRIHNIDKNNNIRIQPYQVSELNTKEISLSEPLRALPNGVKDKVVKIGGKWYVERNCGEERVSDTWKWVQSSATEDYYYYVDDRFKFSEHQINVLCDKLKSATTSQANDKNFYTSNNDYVALGLYSGMGVVAIDLNPNTLVNKTLEGFKEYIRNNKINIIYPLQTPIYEELPIDPTLNTYNDTTHISNNSTIPCNMKIQNTGYNAIIKPSTKYTVAFDTNKSGEVGINLGGAKVTTTNNVATVTTPSTLVDDSLRLTGKGIKASSVRLLEGDKTNWIPSFFEGMKSSFEENLQEDESYKVEIISSNLDNSKSNKLQLQLNEPLRAVGDIKDKLVFKDNKLMVEKNCGIREYQEGDFELDNTLTDKINTTYILNEPTYEEIPYEAQKLILECYENGTLFIDTNIPPTVSVTYSANIPVVAKLNQVNNTTNVNTKDIAITQMAVDFLLMSSLGEEMINFKIKRGTNMSAYFASRIIKGALKYEDVINKYPQYKEDIDLILISEGYSDLIVEL